MPGRRARRSWQPLLAGICVLGLTAALTACGGSSGEDRQGAIPEPGTQGPVAVDAPAPVVLETPPCVDPIDISGSWDAGYANYTPFTDVMTDGTYVVQISPALPRIVFDVPAGVLLRYGGEVMGEHGPGEEASLGYLLERVDGPGWIGIDATTGEVYGLWAPPDNPAFAAGLAALAASVRLDDGTPPCP